jgi:hypothetical protein
MFHDNFTSVHRPPCELYAFDECWQILHLKKCVEKCYVIVGTIPAGGIPKKNYELGTCEPVRPTYWWGPAWQAPRLTERTSGCSDSLSQSAIECSMGSSPRGPVARRLFTSAHCAPFIYTALTKVWIGLASVFLIISGSSLPERRRSFVVKKKVSNLLSYA